MSQSASNVQRLTIAYVLSVTTGVAIAITLTRWLRYLSFSADEFFLGVKHPGELNSHDYIASSVYGLCVVTAIFAFRSPDFWQSPGRIIALAFAFMAVVDLSLTLVASVIMHFRFLNVTDITPGMSRIGGVWYKAFPASVGYFASIPLLLVACYLGRRIFFPWIFAWLGFLLFATFTGYICWWGTPSWYPQEFQWCIFELSIAPATAGLMVGLASSVICRVPTDWWTWLISSLLIAAWFFAMGSKLLS